MEKPISGYFRPATTAKNSIEVIPAMDRTVDMGLKSDSEIRKEWDMENLPGTG